MLQCSTVCNGKCREAENLRTLVQDLKAALALSKQVLAAKEAQVEESRTETCRYRALWMNEARMGMMLLRNLPEGHEIEGYSQAEDDDPSSPFYDHHNEIQAPQEGT